MIEKSFSYEGSTGKKIFTRKWLPENNSDIKAVVQIAHGMAEHSGRYADFAEKLVKEGFVVFANDHLGHGKTAGDIEKLGFFAEKDGWQRVVDDMKILNEIVGKEYKNLPIYGLGHSMGSFLFRTLMIQNGDLLDGVILSGTADDPGLLGRIGLLIAKNEIKRKGKKWKSKLMTKLSFGQFNNSFKPTNTNFDWLSRDSKTVEKYIQDPFCGTVFTSSFFVDMLKGIIFVNDKRNIKKIPKDLPVFLISGDKDPVGKNGKSVKNVYNDFKNAGINNIKIKLYKDARHEILNEINRDIVISDIIGWLEEFI